MEITNWKKYFAVFPAYYKRISLEYKVFADVEKDTSDKQVKDVVKVEV